LSYARSEEHNGITAAAPRRPRSPPQHAGKDERSDDGRIALYDESRRVDPQLAQVIFSFGVAPLYPP